MMPAIKFNNDDPADQQSLGKNERLDRESEVMHMAQTGINFAKRLFPWLVGAGILVYLIWRIELNPLLNALTHADVALYIPVLITFIVLNFLADTQNMHALLKEPVGSITFHDSLIIRGASYLLMIIDYTLGMGSIVYYLKKYKNLSIFQGTGLMLFLSYTTHISLLLMAITGSVLAVDSPSSWLKQITMTCTFVLAIAIMLVILYKILPDKGFLKKIRQSVFVKIFIDSPARMYIINTVYRCGFYFTFILFFYIAVKAFNMDIPFLALVAYVPVILLIISIPISAFGLGTSQAAMLFLFKDYGEPAQIMAFSLTYSASIIVLRGIIGAYYYSIVTKRISFNKFKASFIRGETS
jgi:hypothetical protein